MKESLAERGQAVARTGVINHARTGDGLSSLDDPDHHIKWRSAHA